MNDLATEPSESCDTTRIGPSFSSVTWLTHLFAFLWDTCLLPISRYVTAPIAQFATPQSHSSQRPNLTVHNAPISVWMWWMVEQLRGVARASRARVRGDVRASGSRPARAPTRRH
jgi:hypothetical protein